MAGIKTFSFPMTDQSRFNAELKKFLDCPAIRISLADDLRQVYVFSKEEFDFDIVDFRSKHGGAGLESLGKEVLSSITILNLPSGSRSSDFYEFLSMTPAVESFRLLDARRDTDWSSFAWPKLRKLDLRRAKVNGTSLFGLRSDTLEELDLSGSDFSDGDLNVLLQFPRLRSVDLRETMVTVDGLKILLDHASLTAFEWGPKDREEMEECIANHSFEEAQDMFSQVFFVFLNLPAAREKRLIEHKERWDFYRQNGYFELNLEEW